MTPGDPEKDKEIEDNGKSVLEINKEKLLSDQEYQDCLRKIKNLKSESRNLKVKDYNTVDADIKKLDEEALRLYDQIRENNNDMDRIADNLKIDKKFVERVKEHLFFDEHKLYQGFQRFAPDKNIAESWNRLVDNSYLNGDLELFLHEFAESKLTEAFPTRANSELHSYVDTIHNWTTELLH